MSALQEFAKLLVAMPLQDSLAAEAECAGMRVFDALAAGMIGSRTDEGLLIRKMTAAGGMSETIQLVTGVIRATEIDDIDVSSCTTVGSVVIPAVLALAHTNPDADSEKILQAIIVGYESMVRLARAIDGAMSIYQGVWPTYAAAPFAAAAAAGTLLDLDRSQMERALFLALMRSAAAPTDLGGVAVRPYSLGCAAADGVAAARAALAGIGAGADLVHAFAAFDGIAFRQEALLENFGESWRIAESDVKFFPTSRQALAAVEAFLELTPLDGSSGDLESITVYVPKPCKAMVGFQKFPERRLESLIGAPYQIALAATSPDCIYDAVRTELGDSSALREIWAKVSVQGDPDLSADFPAYWSGRICVKWRSGKTQERVVRDPRGSWRRSVTWEMLTEKYNRIAQSSGASDLLQPLGELMQCCRNLSTAQPTNRAGGLLSFLTWLPDGNSPAVGEYRAGTVAGLTA